MIQTREQIKMRKLTEAAQAAKQIKSELKKLFPKTKFSVVSDNYSMGDAVRISWTDSITQEQVNNVVRKYQYGSFDGMTDSYSNDNQRSDIAQAKYVQTQRSYSDAARQSCFEELKSKWTVLENITDIDLSSHELFQMTGCWTASNFIYRELVKRDLAA